MSIKKMMVLVSALMLANVVVAEVIWSDSFTATDSVDLNTDIAPRSSGSANVQYDTKGVSGAQNSNWSISSDQLSFSGSGSTSANLYLVNRGNGAYQNLYSVLGGEKYEISYSVSVASGSDSPVDSLGVALSDNALGTPELFVGQIRARAQLDVDEAGANKLRADDWVNNTAYTVKLVVDETQSTPTYEVFVDDVSKYSGTVSFGDAQRHIYFQLKDTNGDMNAVVDDFSIEVIPEPATAGLLSAAGTALLVLRRFMMV